MIPAHRPLARGIERLLPEWAGVFRPKAIRVPTLNVSALDITLQTRATQRRRGQRSVCGRHRRVFTTGLVVTPELPACQFW